jgi:cytochrome c553
MPGLPISPILRCCVRAAVAATALSLPSLGAAADGAAIARQGSGALACQNCHGASGEGSAAAGFPRLAGLSAPYLQRQLDAFASGQRRSAVMEPVAKALTPADRSAVAAHYASLPVGNRAPAAASGPGALASGASASAPSATASTLGAELALRGRWSDQLPACEQCHAPGGRGVGDDFPPLAGQPAAYIAAQLRGWKSGQRPPGPMALMPVVAARLSDRDIDAVAQHFASLPVVGGRR